MWSQAGLAQCGAAAAPDALAPCSWGEHQHEHQHAASPCSKGAVSASARTTDLNGSMAAHLGSMAVLTTPLAVFVPKGAGGQLGYSTRSPRRSPFFATVEPPSPPQTIKPSQRPVRSTPSKKNVQK